MSVLTNRRWIIVSAFSWLLLSPPHSLLADVGTAKVSVVVAPDVSQTNDSYVSNRAPLVPSRLIQLPVGSVHPRGWLREMLNRQRQGLTGHLGEISAWLQKDDNAWLSTDGKGKYGWEELPYWLKGYIELAYLFDDPAMIDEVNIWIEGTLASQRGDGDFGPDQRLDDGSRDYWANMVMLFCLESYYEHTHDQRVLDLMTRYFKYQLTVPDDQMLTGYWQHMRGGDNLHSIYWLYNRTGNPDLLKLAEKIHRCTANWSMKDDLPNWHNVNIAECFREPAQYYQQSGNPDDLQQAYGNFFEIRKRFGQVPGGMFGGDENSRAGYDDPRQATETCGFVEQMLSDELLLQITGDPFWADHCEEVAFNSYPAAVMPDFKSLRYLTAPNMVLSDAENHAPGIDNGGPFLMMNPFSSRCCQHNHSHGWPYFTKHLWMATPDNGVCAAMYSASEVNVKVAGGKEVHFVEQSHYPFADTIEFKFHADENVTFPLYLRVPRWCSDAKVSINGEQLDAPPSSGRYVRIERQWADGDRVKLHLPMEIKLQTWKSNHDSVSVNRGPLTYSLKIGEKYIEKDSTETAIGDSSWQEDADPSQWPSFEIHPSTPWNYGLVLDHQSPEESFEVKQGEWPENNFPFTLETAPITIVAQGKRILQWTLDRFKLCAELQDSPVASDQPTETITLVPMGAARLRISAFPVIGNDDDAHHWIAPQRPRESAYEITSSHHNQGDSPNAIDDGIDPENSGDHSIPRFTWWDHKGSQEWVQYVFPQAKKVSEVSVYWFDDTGRGQCRIPETWRVEYLEGEHWKPVSNANTLSTAKDEWNKATFDAVETKGLRLVVKLQPDYSGGVLEWKVK